MRGRNKTWDAWEDSSLDRRDFRDDHGGGPEEIPHRPSKKYKEKHKHDFTLGPASITYESDRFYVSERLESCGCGLNRVRRQWHYKYNFNIREA